MTRSDFAHYFTTGTRIHAPHATLLIAPYPTRKLAVVVSKKVAKSAVTRNTLRRRVYHLLASETTGLQNGWIILLKPSITRLTRQQATDEIRALIGRGRKKQ